MFSKISNKRTTHIRVALLLPYWIRYPQIMILDVVNVAMLSKGMPLYTQIYVKQKNVDRIIILINL